MRSLPTQRRSAAARSRLRLALGADRRRIVSLVVRQGAFWVVGGLIVGVVGARLLTGYIAGLLFKVTENDVATFAGVAVGLTAIALIATAIPALRAARLDPMLTLKAE